jgi:DNA-binding NarL/FixJ family response regulator
MIRLCRLVCQPSLKSVLPPLPADEIVLAGEWAVDEEKSADWGYLRRCITQAQSQVLLLIGNPVNAGMIAALKSAEGIPPILLVTDFSQEERLSEALRLGVSGFWPIGEPMADLLPAIRQLANGECALHPTLSTRLIRMVQRLTGSPESAERLTPRETDILCHVARGDTNRQIAERLVVSERTVRTHMTNILAKLGLTNRTQAAMYALRTGIADLDPSAPLRTMP